MLAGMLRRLTWIALVVYLVVLAITVFWPTPVDRPVDGTLFSLIRWLRDHGMGFVTYDRIEFTANVALFAPFGLLLGLLLRRERRWIAVPICVVCSAAIEGGQALFLPGRFASAADVLANSIGAGIGVLVAVIVARLARARRSTEAAAPNTSRAG
jgi:VanZ family protein